MGMCERAHVVGICSLWMIMGMCYEAIVADNGCVYDSPCGGYLSIVDDNGYVLRGCCG